MTFRRWRKDHGAPAPSFYIAGNPYWWLSVLQAWGRRRPAQSRLAARPRAHRLRALQPPDDNAAHEERAAFSIQYHRGQPQCVYRPRSRTACSLKESVAPVRHRHAVRSHPTEGPVVTDSR